MVILTRRSVLVPAVAALCALVFGCTGPRDWQPTTNPDQLADLEFQAYLADAPLVTVAEGYRAMLILADGEDTSKSFDERRQKLESRGIARAEWKLQPENVIDKGSLSYMVFKICQMRGGINWTLFGRQGLGDRRYAMRELIYRGIVQEAIDYQYLTGGELVAIMSKADEYMETHGVYQATPLDLPPESEAQSESPSPG